jgi:hypothetical protein
MKLSGDPTKGTRRNVLLLGISYPCVKTQMAEHGFPADVLTYKKPSVEQAVECVRRGIMTEMDARDLARCVAVEQATDTDVYSVSREIGAQYRSDRHVHCDFNARNFCKTLHRAFGKDIEFSQVILDYYWMPTGWLVTRWAKTLFQQTLPDLVKHQMLTFPSKRKTRRKDLSEGAPYDIDEGVVFLPFCAHVCKELVGAVHILENYYEISFLHKKDLHGHSLWKGTMEIDADVMQERLGKRLDQEEIYCTFRPQDIYASMEDPHVSKPAVMRILLAIKNYGDIRMVRLRPLRQHERASVFRERLYNDEIGGFKGLDFELARRLHMEMKRGRKSKSALAALAAIEEEKKEDDTVVATKQKKRGRKSKSALAALAAIEEEKKEDDTVVATKQKSASAVKKVTSAKTIKEAKAKKTKKNEKKKVPVPTELPLDESETNTIVSEDVESDEEYFEHSHLNFYPGPARDLEAYINPHEMAAEDKERVAAMKKAQRSKKKNAKNNQKPVGHVSPRKGIVYLPGDEERTEKKRKLSQRCFQEEDADFLTFNHRCPPAVKRWEGEERKKCHARIRRSATAKTSDEPEFVELDWSLVQPDSVEDIITESSSMANGADVNAASLLYHCLAKGGGTMKQELNGVQQVARVDAEGAVETGTPTMSDMACYCDSAVFLTIRDI